MYKTGKMDSKAPGIRTRMTGSRLLLKRLTMASQTSGLKPPADPLRATHGPKNMPATRVERMMLISSQTFKAILDPSARTSLLLRPNCQDTMGAKQEMGAGGLVRAFSPLSLPVPRHCRRLLRG